MSGKIGRSGRHRVHWPDGDETLSLPAIEGEPPKPEFDSEDASQLWDDVSSSLHSKGALTIVDLALLRSTCELWGLYRAAFEAAQAHPIDKDARIAVTSYWAKFEQGAARFGMNPSDRHKIKSTKKTESAIVARKRG